MLQWVKRQDVFILAVRDLRGAQTIVVYSPLSCKVAWASAFAPHLRIVDVYNLPIAIHLAEALVYSSDLTLVFRRI